MYGVLVGEVKLKPQVFEEYEDAAEFADFLPGKAQVVKLEVVGEVKMKPGYEGAVAAGAVNTPEDVARWRQEGGE